MTGIASYTALPQQKPKSEMAVITLAYANNVMDPPQKFFFFRVDAATDILCWCYGGFFLFSDSNVITVYSIDGSTVGLCTTMTL